MAYQARSVDQRFVFWQDTRLQAKIQTARPKLNQVHFYLHYPNTVKDQEMFFTVTSNLSGANKCQ